MYGLFGSSASFFLFIGGLPAGLYTVGATGAKRLVLTRAPNTLKLKNKIKFICSTFKKKKKPKKNFELKSEKKKKKIVIEPSLTDYRGTNPRILQKKKKKEQIPKSKINSKSEITKGLKQTQRVKTEQRANASEESEQRLSSLVIRDRSSPEHAVVVVGDRSLVVACPSSEIARHYLSGLSLQASLLGCFSA